MSGQVIIKVLGVIKMVKVNLMECHELYDFLFSYPLVFIQFYMYYIVVLHTWHFMSIRWGPHGDISCNTCCASEDPTDALPCIAANQRECGHIARCHDKFYVSAQPHWLALAAMQAGNAAIYSRTKAPCGPSRRVHLQQSMVFSWWLVSYL